jgi:hypothetical protein
LAGNPEWNLPLNCCKATLQTVCTEQSTLLNVNQSSTKACIVPREIPVALTLEWEEFTKM